MDAISFFVVLALAIAVGPLMIRAGLERDGSDRPESAGERPHPGRRLIVAGVVVTAVVWGAIAYGWYQLTHTTWMHMM